MLLLLISLLLCAACSPSKRLARLLERHPELKKPDTVVVQDTVAVPGENADTSVPVARIPDTLVVEKGRLQVLL